MEPEFLTVEDANYCVYTSQLSIDQARRYAKELGFQQRILPIMQDAIDRGTVLVSETLFRAGRLRHPAQNEALVTFLRSKLGAVDSAILEIALALRETSPDQELFISLYEPKPKALREAWALEFWADTPHLAVQTLKRANRNHGLLARVRKYKLLYRSHRAFGAAGLIAAAVSAFYILTHYQRPVDPDAKLWMLGLFPILGLVLFWYRSQFRLQYGLIEIAFGCLLAASTLLKESDLRIEANILFQLLASLYVTVRGLDNIEKALSGKSVGKFWRDATQAYEASGEKENSVAQKE